MRVLISEVLPSGRKCRSAPPWRRRGLPRPPALDRDPSLAECRASCPAPGSGSDNDAPCRRWAAADEIANNAAACSPLEHARRMFLNTLGQFCNIRRYVPGDPMNEERDRLCVRVFRDDGIGLRAVYRGPCERRRSTVGVLAVFYRDGGIRPYGRRGNLDRLVRLAARAVTVIRQRHPDALGSPLLLSPRRAAIGRQSFPWQRPSPYMRSRWQGQRAAQYGTWRHRLETRSRRVRIVLGWPFSKWMRTIS